MEEHERGLRRTPPYSFDECMRQEFAKSMVFGTALHRLLYTAPKDNNTYVFRGDIDIRHAVFESIQDGKFAFIAIGPHYTVVGVRSGVLSDIDLPDCMSTETILVHIDGYLIYQIEKRNTSDVIKVLPEAVDRYKKEIKKLALKIHKQCGKFSHYPETKVVTY